MALYHYITRDKMEEILYARLQRLGMINPFVHIAEIPAERRRKQLAVFATKASENVDKLMGMLGLNNQQREKIFKWQEEFKLYNYKMFDICTYATYLERLENVRAINTPEQSIEVEDFAVPFLADMPAIANFRGDLLQSNQDKELIYSKMISAVSEKSNSGPIVTTLGCAALLLIEEAGADYFIQNFKSSKFFKEDTCSIV